jgi:periplasmic protein CpxP/Spy
MLAKTPVTCALTFALTLGSALVSAKAMGQAMGSASPTRHAQGSDKKHSLDEQVKRFAKALDLDQAQQAGVKAILEHQQVLARQIHLDPSLSGSDRIGRFRALQRGTVLRIRALLNDEQRKKYDPLDRGTQTNSSQPSIEDWLKATQH